MAYAYRQRSEIDLSRDKTEDHSSFAGGPAREAAPELPGVEDADAPTLESACKGRGFCPTC